MFRASCGRVAAVLLFSCLCFASTGAARENPTELGLVEWKRDLEGALSEAASAGKPVLLLFQEIPG
jgi:hypothetical protein